MTCRSAWCPSHHAAGAASARASCPRRSSANSNSNEIQVHEYRQQDRASEEGKRILLQGSTISVQYHIVHMLIGMLQMPHQVLLPPHTLTPSHTRPPHYTHHPTCHPLLAPPPLPHTVTHLCREVVPCLARCVRLFRLVGLSQHTWVTRGH